MSTSISSASLVDKILSVFLGVILVSSVGAAGSLYSTQIQSNKAQTISSGPSLFPTFNVANAMPDPNKKNCDSDEMSGDEIDEIFMNNTGLLKTHPIFDFNRTSDMLETKDKNNNTKMVHVFSPYGKLIQEKQKGNSDRENVNVNCHKLLMVEKKTNSTHAKFNVETFTSVKITPNPNKGNMKNEQGPWGDIMAKNTFISNATDLGLNLTDFKTAEVFLDSLTENGSYDVGEFIYSNSTTGIVGEKHIRQFDNYSDFTSLGKNVTSVDSDFGLLPLINFNSTVRYYDNNGDGLFSANETVYHDIDNSKNVTEIDVRLANARFVDERTDEPFVDGKKASFPNDQAGIINFEQFISDCTEGENMGIYNVTSNTCDYTKKFGDHIKKGLMEKGGHEIKFKNKGPDLKNSLKEFTTAIVYLDSNTNNRFDVGESVYRQTGAGDKVKVNDERLANSKIKTDGTLVTVGDADKGAEPLKDFPSITTRYHDLNGNNQFDVGETIYEDHKSPKVDAGDIRLVNAKTIGDEFEDGIQVYQKGVFEDMTGKGNGKGGKGSDIEIGMEPRQFNITETLVLEIPINGTDNANSTAAVFNSVLSSLAAPLSFNGIVAEDPQEFRDVSKEILFGDTIAPFVTFGVNIDIESCFWILGCITWFKFVLAITPFVITGFRLPGRVKAFDIPDREFASKSFDITTDFETFDASYADYRAICLDGQNSLNQPGSYFHSGTTPFDCDDFASYDVMSIPSVLSAISDELETAFLAAAQDPTNTAKINTAFEKFLAVGQILFDPLPPLSVDQIVQRITSSPLTTSTNNSQIIEAIQGQEVVLKVGVIIEIEVVILNIELVDTTKRVEIDVLAVLEGFLLYNELVQSSNPVIYKAEYAKGNTAGPKADYLAIWNLISDYDKMKEKGIVFTSFKAPFGFDENGKIEGFPFLGGSNVPVLSNPDTPYNILYLRGNCIDAWIHGQILKIPAPYGPIPLCSGLYAPGLGQAIFGIQSNIGSKQINAIISTEGDAAPIPKTGTFACNDTFPDTDNPDWERISYCAYLGDQDTNGTKSSLVTRTINVDNHDASTDTAIIKIDDFKYKLQWITIGDLLINFENPTKLFLPEDIHNLKINLFTKSFDIIDIPQHPRVAGLSGTDVVVFNYAVKVNDLDGNDAINQPNGTKPIKAANFTQSELISFEERSYANVTYNNIGNSLDKIQNLTITFPDLHPLNTNPGPDESWMSDKNQTELDKIFYEREAGGMDQLDIAIKPARHWTTTPSFADNGDLQAGIYKVKVMASSANATENDMPNKDPLGNFRIDSPNYIQVNVTQFGNPVLTYTENVTESKPGPKLFYNANIANFGNDFDVINFTDTREDSNKGGCDLFAKGPDNSTCQFRANFTSLQISWTNSTDLCDYYWNETIPCDDETMNDGGTEEIESGPNQSPNYNKGELGLNVTESRDHKFWIQVPGNWAGIDDTLYQLRGDVVSMEDKRDGTNTEFLNHTVIATKESSIRYVSLEIDEMKEKVTNANSTMIDKGSQTALTQILDRAIESANERALEIVCENNSRGGPNNALKAAQRQLGGLIRAIEGMSPSNIEINFAGELISNANATIEDIDEAIANNITSEVACTEDFDNNIGKIRVSDFETDNLNETSPPIDSDTVSSDVKKEDKSKSSNNSVIDTKTSGSSNIPTPSIKEPSTEAESKSEKVPLWIKNNARWWADKQIKDSDFILGIQYLIEENVIVIPSLPEQTSQKAGDSVPEWVRNNANWWSEDLISEKEFLDAIKYLVNEGIIQIAN